MSRDAVENDLDELFISSPFFLFAAYIVLPPPFYLKALSCTRARALMYVRVSAKTQQKEDKNVWHSFFFFLAPR